MGTNVLFYGDAFITDRDVQILDQSTSWLSGEGIFLQFEYFRKDIVWSRKDIIFISPDISTVIYKDPEDIHVINLGELEKYGNYILFIPVNDGMEKQKKTEGTDEEDWNEWGESEDSYQSEDWYPSEEDKLEKEVHTAAGTHWALLVFERKKNAFQYYDSKKDSGVAPVAERISEHIRSAIKTISGDDGINFEEMDTPKQNNNADCGLYVCAIAEYLMREYLDERQEPLKEMITTDYIFKYRYKMGDIVMQKRLDALVISDFI